MNIDIINKQTSKNLKIDEKKVALVNQFYWSCNRAHIYSFNPAPLTISYVCVLYPDKYLVKRFIKSYITKIRYTKVSRKFTEGSKVRAGYILKYEHLLKGFLNIRKVNKWVN